MIYASLDTLRQYLPQVPEDGVQVVTVSGATGGTFALSYEGTAAAALAWNATATTVQAALRAIAAIGSAGVTVRGRPGGPYTAAFQGTLATDAGPLTTDASGLTPVGTVTIAPAADSVLQSCLTRASDIVRNAIRAGIGDPAFDYAPWELVPSTRLVRGVDGLYLDLPPHQAGSVTSVAYQSGSSPLTYRAYDASEWAADSSGRLYRPSGWAAYGSSVWASDWFPRGVNVPLYQITAIYGYGPDVPPSIEEIVLEQAVNEWRSRDRGGFSEIIGAEGQGSVRAVAGLNTLQQQVIDNLAMQLREIAL